MIFSFTNIIIISLSHHSNTKDGIPFICLHFILNLTYTDKNSNNITALKSLQEKKGAKNEGALMSWDELVASRHAHRGTMRPSTGCEIVGDYVREWESRESELQRCCINVTSINMTEQLWIRLESHEPHCSGKTHEVRETLRVGVCVCGCVSVWWGRRCVCVWGGGGRCELQKLMLSCL